MPVAADSLWNGFSAVPLTPAGKRRGEKDNLSTHRCPRFSCSVSESSVGVTVNPLRDPLFYLMFATLFALTIIGLVFFYAVEFLEKLLIPWHVTHRVREDAGTM